MTQQLENFLFGNNFQNEKEFIECFLKEPINCNQKIIYLTGATSSGKTHLLNVFEKELLMNKSVNGVKIISAEDLLIFLIETIKKEQFEKFIEHFFQFDILLIDNYEKINGRPKTSEIFVKFFNAFMSRNKRIVIASNDKQAFKLLNLRLANISIYEIDLDKNNFDFEKLIEVKLKERGLKKTTKVPFTESNDIREIEGFMNSKKLIYEINNI